MVDTEYTPPPRRTRNPEFLKLPMPQFSMLDKGRQMEVDNFFMASQMHRDTYMDHSKILKPMDFFKPPVYKYQCPQDLSSTYLKYPTMYVEYKKPTVLPLTLGRTRRSPLYPEKALTGIFNPESDISHKK
ncbi:uncharacterized protein LOC109597606 isoform X2 [Aethina tumida]|nr:uncharacterized protein LOC109597606 isoform X2 [Aethina tumida]